MLSARRAPSPRTPRHDSARVAELIRCSGGHRSHARSASGGHPPKNKLLGTRGAHVDDLGLMETVCSVAPTWGNAALHASVQASVQTLVQPRLDSLAANLATVFAQVHAHSEDERRKLQQTVEHSETRLEGRVTSLEARVAVLVDGCARTEQRERNLNERIAGMGQDLLRGAEVVAERTGQKTRLDELDRRCQETEARLDQAEDQVRRGTKNIRRLDQAVEERGRAFATFEEALQGLQQTTAEVTAGRANERGFASRLEHLESQMHILQRIPVADATSDGRLAMLEGRVSGLVTAVSSLEDACGNSRSQLASQAELELEHWEQSKVTAEKQQALVARADDFNLRIGALKVRADGLDGRLQAMGERVEASATGLEVQLREQLVSKGAQLAADFRSRLEVLERRTGTLMETCEDVVEQALERRLAALGDSAGRLDDRNSRVRKGTPAARNRGALVTRASGLPGLEEQDEEG